MRYHDIAKVARINSSGLSFGGTLYDDTLTLERSAKCHHSETPRLRYIRR